MFIHFIRLGPLGLTIKANCISSKVTYWAAGVILLLNANPAGLLRRQAFFLLHSEPGIQPGVYFLSNVDIQVKSHFFQVLTVFFVVLFILNVLAVNIKQIQEELKLELLNLHFVRTVMALINLNNFELTAEQTKIILRFCSSKGIFERVNADQSYFQRTFIISQILLHVNESVV